MNATAGPGASALPAAAALAGGGPVGGASAALHVPTVLSFVAVLLAGMQGVLVLESSYPCRISVAKLLVLLVLEGLEVVIVLASEVLTYRGLADALRVRVVWLRWAPGWVLAVGVLQLALDALFTLDLAVESRVNFRPVCVRADDAPAWEIAAFAVTGALSTLLVGWRQRWWWAAPPADPAAAAAAVRAEPALQAHALAAAIGFAFAVLAAILAYVALGEMASLRCNTSLARRARHALASDRWHCAVSPDGEPRRYPSPQLVASFRAISAIAPRDGDDPAVVAVTPDVDLARWLEREPLRIGNTVLGEDIPYVVSKRTCFWATGYRVFLYVENLVIIPLMVCVVVAVARLHNKLDGPTFEALKELSEVVIVVAFLDLSITIKNLLWNYSEKKEYVPERDGVGDAFALDAKVEALPYP